jgi:hypothetical protein
MSCINCYVGDSLCCLLCRIRCVSRECQAACAAAPALRAFGLGFTHLACLQTTNNLLNCGDLALVTSTDSIPNLQPLK